MTNFSGKPLSSQTANAACGDSQGVGMDSRRNGVAEMSSTYPAEIGSKSIPVGYKQTEVGVIPDDWGVSSFDNISSLIGDGIHTTPNYDENGDFYFVNGNNLVNGSISLDGNTKKTNLTEYKKHKKPLNQRTLLLSINGTIGNVAEYNNESIVLGKSAAFINVKKGAEKKYIFYVLCSHRTNLSFFDGLTGSTIKNLGLGTIRTTLLPIPPEKEQTAIANALSDVDALISELEKLIAKKQAIKTATMQQLLTGRTRLPQFALREDGTPTNSSGTNLDAGAGGPKGEGQDGLRKGTKPSELGEIPEDWDAIKMGDLAKIQRGASPRPIDSPIWFERNSTVGWLRISDVTKTSKYLTETTQSLSELGIANSRFVPENNLVMSICATVGKPIITKKDLCIHDGFVVFNGLSVNQDFMYYILKELEDEWSKQGQTGSQMNLNTDLINGTYVAVPKDKTEQTAIATILSDMDEEIQALEQRLGKTRQIKQGMMQELLTGKTRLMQPQNKECQHG